MKKQIIWRMSMFLIVYSCLIFYITYNEWIWLNTVFGLENKWLVGIVTGFLAFSYMIGSSMKQLSFFRIAGAYWLAFLQYALILFPLANLAVLSMTALGFHPAVSVTWTGYAVMTALLIIFGYGTYNAYSPVVRKYAITIPKRAKQGQLRIAMASDMHFGHLSGKSHLTRLVKGVNNLKPDLILLPGDIIDDDPDPFIRKGMGEMMKELSAPLGIYGVLGNHEYYGGKVPIFLKEMERIGIKILLDETVKINDDFYLVGRKDKTDRNRKSMADLAFGLDNHVPAIMMDHQPAELENAEKIGMDLLLSGHTHRGQMAPNHLITRRLFELDWGYLQKNQLHAIVSSGFGFWGPPLRMGSRSEIVCIDITFSS